LFSQSKKPDFTPIVNNKTNGILIFSFLERLIKLTMRWTEHLTPFGLMRNTHNIIRKTLKEREHLGDLDLEDNIKTNLKAIRYKVVGGSYKSR
jgi:hypothetical protein